MRPWLRLLRISNLPTVWSNVLLGVVAGGVVAGRDGWALGSRAETLYWQLVFALGMTVGISLLYVGGMALNDVLDSDTDATHDPQRPIPRGEVSRRNAGFVAVLLLTAGLSWLLAYRDPSILLFGSLLLTAIVGYNVLHHRLPASRLLVGLCRALAIVTAAMAVDPKLSTRGWFWLAGVAALPMIYTWLVSALAASESLHGNRRRGTVLALIASMPILDAAIVLVMGHWPAACVCLACAALTRVWHRWVSGT